MFQVSRPITDAIGWFGTSVTGTSTRHQSGKANQTLGTCEENMAY
jgi:hypothetical protein